MQVVVTRFTSQLNRMEEFYCKGMDFIPLSQSPTDLYLTNNDLCPDLILHFKLSNNKLDCTPPSDEHLLVFYINDLDRWKYYKKKMLAQSDNVFVHKHFWDKEGLAYTDPDGFKLVFNPAIIYGHKVKIVYPCRDAQKMATYFTLKFGLERLSERAKTYPDIKRFCLGVPEKQIHLELIQFNEPQIDEQPFYGNITFLAKHIMPLCLRDPQGDLVSFDSKSAFYGSLSSGFWFQQPEKEYDPPHFWREMYCCCC